MTKEEVRKRMGGPDIALDGPESLFPFGRPEEELMKAHKKNFEYVSIPPGLKARFKGVSVGKDKQGFFCYTHRARSNSYPTLEAIPQSKIRFIESTG